MGLSDAWDYIVDAFDYFIHFEWVGDFWEGVVDLFSNIGEVSSYGIVMGLCGVAFLIFTKSMMLDSFTKFMNPVSGFIVTILTFVATFVVCYLLGLKFENS